MIDINLLLNSFLSDDIVSNVNNIFVAIHNAMFSNRPKTMWF